MDEREGIKAKIARLMMMGNDHRTNEFEAEAALRLASKLMRKHAIEQAELAGVSGTKPRFDWITAGVPADPQHPTSTTVTWIGQLGLGVARFTDTIAIWKREPAHGYCIMFSGDVTDVNFAVYLAKHLRDTVRRDSAAFVGSRRERETFRRAMVARICDRMESLKAEQKAEMQVEEGGGKAMVLVSTKLAARDARFGGQKTGKSSRRDSDPYARDAGKSAGDRVGFGKPVGLGQAYLT